MHRSIDYYFSLVSPWAYIGHATFMSLTQRHSLDVNFKPVSLPTVFAETGGLPLNKRAPARQRYRIMELRRWREKRGVQLNVHPKFWPFNVETADHLTVAIVESGAVPISFSARHFRGFGLMREILPTSKRSLCSPMASDFRHKSSLRTPRARALKRDTRRILRKHSRSMRSARPATCSTARCSGARTASSCWTTH
jgi:hypothetical protein